VCVYVVLLHGYFRTSCLYTSKSLCRRCAIISQFIAL